MPPPASEAAPPDAPLVAPGQLSLDASDYVFDLRQAVSVTIQVADDSNSMEGFQLTASVPTSLTLLSAADGSVSSDGENNVVGWTLPAVSSTQPFVRQLSLQAERGKPGDSFRLTLRIAKTGYEARTVDLLMGLGNLNNHELYVLLDPALVADGITIVTDPVSDMVTGTVSSASLDLSDLSCTGTQECWGAEASFGEEDWVDRPVSEEPTSDLPVGPQLPDAQSLAWHLYLPWMSSQADNQPDTQSDNRVKPDKVRVSPKWDDGGVALHSLWHINAKKLANKLEKLDRPATLIFSAKQLIKKGIDPTSLQLWTRPEESPVNSKWQQVRIRYDAEKQIFIASTSHFSTWGLGDGMISSGQYQPSLHSFSTDLFSGAAVVNIPLESPQGLGGMNPGLSLSYNSRTADDVDNGNSNQYDYSTQGDWAGGFGWSLGGMSSIQYVEDKGFYMNFLGMSLKLAYQGNGQWKSDPETFLKISHDWEVENSYPCESFSTYYCQTNPWTVQTPDGTTYRFGNVYTKGAQPDAYTSYLLQNWFNIPGSVQPAYYTRMTGHTWYLREVVDPLGNRMDYVYESETRTFGTSCSSMRSAWNGTAPGNISNPRYTRATYLREVRYSGHNTSGQSDYLLSTLRLYFNRVARPAGEIQVQNWNNDCVQSVYSNDRLSEVLVQVRTGANWETAGAVHTLRRYVPTYTMNGCTTNVPCHALMTSLGVYGKNGTDLLQSYIFTYSGSLNLLRMSNANNGLGGEVRYAYGVLEDYPYNNTTDTTTGACFGLINKCNSRYQGTARRYYSISTLDTYDGLGNSYRTSFAYNNSHRAYADDNGFESLGHNYVDVKIYALNDPNTLVHEEEHRYHQLTANNTRDQRRGKEYQSVVLSGAKKKLQLVDTTWTQSGTWVRQDVITTTLCSPDGANCVNKASKFFYDPANSGNVQYGNLSQVQEFLNSFHLRTTTTWYKPNPTAYIVNKPSRIVLDGRGADNSSWVCLSDKRLTYDRTDGNNGIAPTKGLLTRLDTALTSCTDTSPLNERSMTNWAIQSMTYDVYGNQTKLQNYGNLASQDQIIDTSYDPTFRFFAIQQSSAGLVEKARYYGVNATDGSSTIALTDSRAFWGAMAEHCAVNGTCTRQTYDVFGRPTNRWEKVAENSSWDLTASVQGASNSLRQGRYKSADVQWNYYKPGELSGSNNTFVVQAWRSPRCEGNFTRSHYNGLGQLVLEQRPYQDWGHIADGCGTADSVGSEIHIHYGYNSLGQQTRVAVPVLAARNQFAVALPAETTRWSGRTYSQNSYDAIGRVLETVAPNGERTTHSYSGHGHSTFQISRDSGIADKTIRWEATDLYGRLETVRSYSKATGSWVIQAEIQLTHDGSGNLTKVTRTMDGSTTLLSNMSYDLAGHKLTMNDLDLGNWSYRYDRQDNLTRQTDARGKTTCLYSETKLSRLAVKHFRSDTNCPALSSFDGAGYPLLPVGSSYDVRYRYDENHTTSNRSLGQLTQLFYEDGHWSKTLTYTDKGLLASETVAIAGTGSVATSYGYDAYLRPTTTTYPDGEVLTLSYNSMGLPTTLVTSQGTKNSSGNWVAGMLVGSASYDEAGRLIQMQFPLGKNLWQSRSYYPWTGSTADSNGRLKQISIGTSSTSSSKLKVGYNYDSFGNIRTYSENYNSSPSDTSFGLGYDDQNRLTGGMSYNYNYDKAGRLTSYEGTSYTAYRGHAVSDFGGMTQRYFDANGNTTLRWMGSGWQILTWDAENHLATVDTGNGVYTYSYDANGQRVKQVTNSGTSYYPFPHYEVINGVVTKYYFFNGQRIARKAGTILFFQHSDQLGSTLMETNNNGTLVSNQSYYAYGRTRSGGAYTEYKYTGQMTDASGLMYYNSRYYDPSIGQFISPDSMVPEPGLVSDYARYTYVRGNPMSHNDPTGHIVPPCNNPSCKEGAEIADYSAVPEVVSEIVDVVAFLVCLPGECVADTQNDIIRFPTKNELAVSLLADSLGPQASLAVSAYQSYQESKGCSFSAETLVMTASGLKPISEVKKGDLVLAWDEATGRTSYFEVTDELVHLDPVIVTLTLDGEVIHTTPEHPFYANGQWVQAGMLQVGDQVYKAGGTTGTIEAINVAQHPQMMYNLTVNQAHTFFVGHERWLVHNACNYTSVLGSHVTQE